MGRWQIGCSGLPARPSPSCNFPNLAPHARRMENGRKMKSREAKVEFEKFVAETGAVVAEFKPIDAVRLMLDFYLQERVEGLGLATSDDRLQFRWGVHEYGNTDRIFEFILTRQVLADDGPENDNYIHLSLTCGFTPTLVLEAIRPGSKCCASPDELADFEYFVVKSPAFLAVGKLRPVKVALMQCANRGCCSNQPEAALLAAAR